MFMYLLIGGLVLTSVSCHVQMEQANNNSFESSIVQTSNSEKDIEPEVRTAINIVDSFSNQSDIGRPKRNKILIDIVERDGDKSSYRHDNLAIVKFYSVDPAKQILP